MTEIRFPEDPPSRQWIEPVLLMAAFIGCFWLSAEFNLFEAFGRFAEQHEDWQLDEGVFLFVLGTVAGLVLTIRRSVALSRELKARAAAEAQIRRMAMHDPLTGLANRRKIRDSLRLAILARKRGKEVTAVLMIDLDRFKAVNDTHGHGVGDRLLKAVADRLQECVREGELVARLGGDEFAVLLPRVSNTGSATRPARRILKAMGAPFEIDNLSLRIGASVGVAVTRDTADDCDRLLHRADVALYRAKREGRGDIRYFEEEMDSEIRARAALELEFRDAMLSGAVTPYYQALVELSTGRIKGYELLARWIHPVQGVIAPEVFIPIAEDTGLVGEMCLRLVRQACIDSRGWVGRPVLAVNISPLQLRDPGLAAKLLAVLAETGFASDRLEVEITENALVADFEAAKKTLLALKAHGVQIALDDFGTGYSSLNHLRELPFDLLKIDRSFIMSMAESPESRKIVDAIVGLSRSLGLVTVAEGIESPEALARLNALGCELGQGFLYGRPAADANTLQPPARQVA